MLFVLLMIGCGEEESAPQVWTETVSYDCATDVQGDAITVDLPEGTKGWEIFRCGALEGGPWTCQNITNGVGEYDYTELYVPCDDGEATTAELRAWGVR